MTAYLKFILLLIIIVLFSDNVIQAQSYPSCGDKFRIETWSGTTLRCKLQHNYNDSLILQTKSNEFQTIHISEIANIHLIEKRRGSGAMTGFLIGSAGGAVIGFMWRLSDLQIDIFDHYEEPNEDWKFFVPTLIGGVIGGFLGYHTHRTVRVDLEHLPKCHSSTQDEISFKLSFAFKF